MPRPDPNPNRRQQILEAAVACFAQRGFHQTSMHDISGEAGISVGLIYRYFQNKEAVIAAMAEQYKADIDAMLQHAHAAPSLLEALEILFASPCQPVSTVRHSAFVVDLFAEAGRNPGVASLIRELSGVVMNGLTALIARAPEVKHTGLSPGEIAELICAVNRGRMMSSLLEPSSITDEETSARQLSVARRLWRLLCSPTGRNS